MSSQSVGLYFEAVDPDTVLIVRTKAFAVVRLIKETSVPSRGIGVRSPSPNNLVCPAVHREVFALKCSGFHALTSFVAI
jgi:hypothetical protein